MKKRLLFILSALAFMIILTPIVFLVFRTQGRSRYAAIVLVAIFYLFIYAYWGISKTLIYLIYGVATSVLLLLFSEYQFPFIMIGTLLMIINPLVSFEKYLIHKLSNDMIEPINLNFFARNRIYGAYRSDMKDSIHMPQMRKLFTNQRYKYLRQATYVLVTAITLFVFISQINTMIQTIESFSFVSFFGSSYAIIVLIIINMLLYRKGFTTAIRYLILLLFPPVIFYLSVSDMPPTSKVISIVATSLLMAFVMMREIFNYYQRVTYECYQYYDNDLQQEVYANALFEPYVYNDAFVEEYVYKLPITKQKFDKIFKSVIIYANYYRFFIVTYTVSHEQVTLYAHFKSSRYKRAIKFITFLESLINTKIVYEQYYDPGKSRYEKMFFHKDDYIVSRTLYLVDFLKNLEVKNKVILNLFVYFKKHANLSEFMEKYPIMRLHDYDFDSNRAVLVSLEIANTDYLIETTLRAFLLNLMICQGNFVRVNVEYRQ